MNKAYYLAMFLSLGFVHAFGHYFIPPAVCFLPAYPREGKDRAASLPYISGDGFRSLAKFHIDEYRIPINPDDVQAGDIIYMKTDSSEFFFNTIHPQIKNKYILITHNSDSSAPGNFLHILNDEKLIAWFALNTDTHHPKLFPIPIGIGNRAWTLENPSNSVRAEHGCVTSFNAMTSGLHAFTKDKLLYLNFTIRIPGFTNYIREDVQGIFAQKTFCYKTTRKPIKEYLSELAQSKFVLSPHGLGLDCHRTWESLLMGSIPVVKTSTLDPLYAELPVLIVSDWHQVTEEFLLKKYEEMKSKSYKMERIYAEYWHNKIKKCQQDFLNNNK